MLKFTEFTPSMKDEITKWLSLINTTCYEYQYSYYLFYGKTAGYYLAFDDVAMYTYIKDIDAFLMPATHNMCEAVKRLKDYCAHTGIPFVIRAVPEDYTSLFSCCTTIFDRDLSDYLYTPDTLINLRGRHLQPKRNHINQFEKNYSGHFSPLAKEDFDLCYDFLLKWYKEHQSTDIGTEFFQEKMAIKAAFEHFDTAELIGAKLIVDGNLVAFTIGEIVNEGKLGIVHYEKADFNYIGSYSIINQYFAKTYLANVELINREEDMGLEGLRKAKLSYQPAKIGNKYTVIL